MSDIFISYSRLDKDFVGNLRDALAGQQQDVWIDWESIPPSQVTLPPKVEVSACPKRAARRQPVGNAEH